MRRLLAIFGCYILFFDVDVQIGIVTQSCQTILRGLPPNGRAFKHT